MSGLSLAEIQGRLKDYLLAAEDDPVPVLPLLATDYGLPGEKRLGIYHNAYRARLTEALEAVFERTWAYLGDQEFYELSAGYIEASPSAVSNLRDYGSTFPAYLAHHQPDDPEVAELAVMDWNLHIAFDAPDAASLLPAALGELGEEDWAVAGFSFQPGLSLAVFGWNVAEIWHAIDQGEVPPPAVRLGEPTAHVFWRQAQRSHFRSLPAAEFRMLACLHQGAGFAESCEQLSPHFSDLAGQAGPWLYRWMADSMLSAIVLHDEGSN
jgi:hypothetical protein